MKNVIVETSQYSRQAGRVSPDVLLDRLEKERAALAEERRDIEFKLSQVEDWKRKETSKILMRKLNKTDSIRATTSLESQVREKKAPLIEEKRAIEKRLHDIKSHFKARTRSQTDENLEALLRIEKLLQQLVGQAKPHNQEG